MLLHLGWVCPLTWAGCGVLGLFGLRKDAFRSLMSLTLLLRSVCGPEPRASSDIISSTTCKQSVGCNT